MKKSLVCSGNEEDVALLRGFEAVLLEHGVRPVHTSILRSIVRLMPIGERLLAQVERVIAVDNRRSQKQSINIGSGKKLPIRLTDEDHAALSLFKEVLKVERINVSHVVVAGLMLVSPDSKFIEQAKKMVESDNRRLGHMQGNAMSAQHATSVFIWDNALARLHALERFLRENGMKPTKSLVIRTVIRCIPRDESFKNQVEMLKFRRQRSMKQLSVEVDPESKTSSTRRKRTV
jgi:hypothetical protein